MSISRGYWVLDGGLATEIEKRGFQINDDPLWSARLLHTNPAVIRGVHKRFLENGADIVITSSYQVSVEGLCKYLDIDESSAVEVIGLSVSLAVEARETINCQHSNPSEANYRVPPLIAGSVGPYGACQHDGSEYHGNYVEHMTSKQLEEWHRPRVAKLLESEVDLLACETLPALKEAEAIVNLLKEFPSARVWMSFSCKDGQHTCHGELFADVVKSISKCSQVEAIGINCTHPQYVEPLLLSAQGTTDKPFIVYPNSGEDWNQGEGWMEDDQRFKFTACVSRWMELGARIIGGCCRVNPQDIREIKETVDSYRLNK